MFNDVTHWQYMNSPCHRLAEGPDESMTRYHDKVGHELRAICSDAMIAAHTEQRHVHAVTLAQRRERGGRVAGSTLMRQTSQFESMIRLFGSPPHHKTQGRQEPTLSSARTVSYRLALFVLHPLPSDQKLRNQFITGVLLTFRLPALRVASGPSSCADGCTSGRRRRALAIDSRLHCSSASETRHEIRGAKECSVHDGIDLSRFVAKRQQRGGVYCAGGLDQDTRDHSPRKEKLRL
jgi:hypothetical protein